MPDIDITNVECLRGTWVLEYEALHAILQFPPDVRIAGIRPDPWNYHLLKVDLEGPGLPAIVAEQAKCRALANEPPPVCALYHKNADGMLRFDCFDVIVPT